MVSSKSSAADKAYNYLLRLLTRRDHSHLELTQKLSRYYVDSAVQAALERAETQKYLADPDKLAAQWQRGLSQRNKSGRQINMFLKKRGLPALPINFEMEKQSCLELLRKKFSSLTDWTPQDKAKAYRHLTSRGFAYDTVREVIRQLIQDKASEL